jgi:adenylosuccinate synthase
VRFADKLRELLEFHNFVLEKFYGQEPVDFQKTLDDALALAPRFAALVADVPRALYHANKRARTCCSRARRARCSTSTTAPIRSSPRPTASAGAAAAGAGIGPMHLHYVLGITKAYSTRVGEGPFPTELSDDVGERLRQRGKEFGATTGSPRRTGWFDAAALKRSIQLNGVSGCASPSSTCSTASRREDLRRLRASTASCRRSCRSAPRSSSAACRCTRSCPAGRKAPSG